jgi:hypothetical protein
MDVLACAFHRFEVCFFPTQVLTTLEPIPFLLALVVSPFVGASCRVMRMTVTEYGRQAKQASNRDRLLRYLGGEKWKKKFVYSLL